MRHYLVLAHLILLPLVHAGAQATDGFFLEFGATLESEASLGMLSAAVESDPLDAGADALLTSADLLAAGVDSSPQTILLNRLTLSVEAGFRLDATIVEALGSGMVHHSPGRYESPLYTTATLGPSGVRITRFPRRWDDGVLELTFGRVHLQDPSAMVVDQLVDGALAMVRFPRAFALGGVGTTRFVGRYFYDGRLVPGDAAVFASDDLFAPERILGLIRVEYGPLAGQTLGIHASFYDDRESGVGFNSVYPGIAIEGPIVGSLSHSTQAVIQATTVTSGVGLLAWTTLNYAFRPLPIDVVLETGFASGASGSLSEFTAVSPRPISPGLGITLTDLLWVDVGVETELMLFGGSEPVVPRLNGVLLFDVTGPDGWVGFEATGSFSYRILSDLVLEGSAGLSQSELGWAPHFSLAGRIEL